MALADARFRRLLTCFACTALAGAITATLLHFYVRDALGLPRWLPAFLALYFLSAACAMPLWMRLVGRLGLVKTWLAGMLLSVAAFVWVPLLPADGSSLAGYGFMAVCITSGAAVATDLALPAALLAGVVARAEGEDGKVATCFGIWNFVSKAALALAAGIMLPALDVLGYRPGSGQGLTALTLAYVLPPCLLKIASAALLWRAREAFAQTPETSSSASPHTSASPDKEVA